jgi:hypothetical protein
VHSPSFAFRSPSKPAAQTHAVPSALKTALAGHAHWLPFTAPTLAVDDPTGHAAHACDEIVPEYVPRGQGAHVVPSIWVPRGQPHSSVPSAAYPLSIVGSPHAQSDGFFEPTALAAPGGHALHACILVSSPKVLAGQGSQIGFTAAPPNVPIGQSEQAFEPTPLVRPTPQLTQSARATLPLVATAVPAGQDLHRSRPVSSAYDPGPHASHAVVSAAAAAVPLAHLAHATPHDWPAAALATRYHPPPWSAPHS